MLVELLSIEDSGLRAESLSNPAIGFFYPLDLTFSILIIETFASFDHRLDLNNVIGSRRQYTIHWSSLSGAQRSLNAGDRTPLTSANIDNFSVFLAQSYATLS